MDTEKYWLIIEPYVYISVNSKKGFIYNTLNSDYFETEDQQIILLLKDLLIPENLYVTSISKNQLEIEEVATFVKNIKDKFIGDILSISMSNHRPVQSLPLLKIMNNETNHKLYSGNVRHAELIKYLNEISFYLLNECNHECKNCLLSAKQTLFCKCQSGTTQQIQIELIKALFNSLQRPLTIANFIGGNILLYNDIDELLAFIKDQKIKSNFVFHYNHLMTPGDFSNFQDDNFNIIINVDNSISQNNIDRINLLEKEYNLNYIIRFYAQSIEDISFFESLKFSGKASKELLPLYNGDNLTFFEQAVFLTKDSIFSSNHNYESIFLKQTLNSQFFGKLIIDCNGDIYSSLNTNKLGNITDNIYEIIKNELQLGNNWRRTRTNLEPCKDCNFKFLCPEVSNYEYVLGSNNLCTIESISND